MCRLWATCMIQSLLCFTLAADARAQAVRLERAALTAAPLDLARKDAILRPVQIRVVQDTTAPPGWFRVAGTALGTGLVFAAGLGAVGGVVGSGEGSIISESAAFAALGAGVGYPIGVAVGARRAASRGGQPPSWPLLLLASVFGGAAGAGVTFVIAEIGDEAPSSGHLMGAIAAGASVHLAFVTRVARAKEN